MHHGVCDIHTFGGGGCYFFGRRKRGLGKVSGKVGETRKRPWDILWGPCGLKNLRGDFPENDVEKSSYGHVDLLISFSFHPSSG